VKAFLSGLVVAVITALLDQYSKHYIFGILAEIPSKQIEILPFFNLVMVQNFGVSFGMFNNMPNGHLILSVMASLIALVLLIWMWRAKKLYLSVALGLIIGGAVGNIIDRVRYGAVADFLDVYWGNYHWPAFNLADSAVFVGVVLILLENFVTGDGNAKKN
jgi:signal peptidase II